MFKNYLATLWRNVRKNTLFATLNLGGLAVSLAACMIMLLWVYDELHYDTAGANANRVYRVALTLRAKGQPDKHFAETAAPLAPVLIKDFPEVEKAVRFEPYTELIAYQNKHFYSDKFLFADPSFFDVFGFSLVKGDPHTALAGGNSVVITQNMAAKYFGTDDPIGRVITCHDSIPLTVTGVAKDLPPTSHFSFESDGYAYHARGECLV